METTKLIDEPRVLFSAPVYKNEELCGVVFISKEIKVLERNMFRQSMFGGKAGVMIVDHDGNILVKNDQAESDYHSAQIAGDLDASADDRSELLNNVKNGNAGSIFLGQNDERILAYAPIDQNDWYLFCIIDREATKVKYAPNFVLIRRTIIVLFIVFLLSIAYFFVLTLRWINEKNSSLERYKLQYARNVELLRKIQCNLVEYDVKKGLISVNDDFQNAYGYRLPEDFFQKIEERKLIHPEFDYDGLLATLNYAIEHQTTSSFESILQLDSSTYKMLSIVMMPLLSPDGEVTDVLGAVRETSKEHLQLKEMVDMFNQVPGGTHRCYLSEPIHLEYASECLCKMLGYSVEEFNMVVGEKYINVVVEEDRKKFIEFIRESAQSPGVRSCEYGMRCKNGEILRVLDTMESIRNQSGIMYGYSAVTDISKYVERQNLIRQELKQLEQSLEMARIKNSTSQMQPHFLYNALASIREIILDDPQYASDLICDFTTYLRACIRTMSNDELISINQELENINAYVNIEKMRMGKRLQVVYHIDSEDFQIVPLSIQPLVENAIRHGIYRRGKVGGTVTITIESFTEYNRITVEDNGVGFDYQQIRNEIESGERDSSGLDNVNYRLKKQMNADMIIDSKVNAGTKIMVYVPKERSSYAGDRS